MARKSITESDSKYDHLELMSTEEILRSINAEDASIALEVKKVIPAIQKLVDQIVPRMLDGGRLFYVGAGTSGRLGVVDASECPPTFGVSDGLVIGLIAGGDGAIRKAVEFAEDDQKQGWKDILGYNPTTNDTLIGIAASGSTPYVVGAVESARAFGMLTGCIACNEDSPLSIVCEYPIEVLVGPEFLTGSTRMKAGTAQKMILNMLSTSVMIKLGRVKGNKMVDMQLTNTKLVERAVTMIVEELGLSESEAREALTTSGSVRKVLEYYK